jgi:hypothetical protein
MKYMPLAESMQASACRHYQIKWYRDDWYNIM